MSSALRQFVMQFLTRLREEDKRLHMAWSFWIMLAARMLWPSPWAFAAVLLLGFGKELWDKRFGSGFCYFDILANILGCTFALILTVVFPEVFSES